MNNPLVDAAITGLEAIGIPVTPSTSFLVELLIGEGIDPLEAFPKIVSKIQSLGGTLVPVLEEVANGMLLTGPLGYVQGLVHRQIDPLIQTALEIQQNKSKLANTHRTMLVDISRQLEYLSPAQGKLSSNSSGMGFSGMAAEQMTISFEAISAQISSLTLTIDQSQRIEQELQQHLEFAYQVLMDMAILDLLILAVGLVAAPFTEGGSLVLAGGIDASLILPELEVFGALVLVAFVAAGIEYGALEIQNVLQAKKAQPIAVPNPDSLPPDVRKKLEDAGLNGSQMAAAAILYAKGMIDVNQLITIIKGLNSQQLAAVQVYGQNPNLTANDILNLVTHIYKYEPNPKHGKFRQGDANPAPTDGQRALDNAVSVNPDTTTRLIGVDPETGEIVIFDETYPGSGIYHGHVRSWKELKQPQLQNALTKKGLIDAQGRIILRDALGKIIGKGINIIKGK